MASSHGSCHAGCDQPADKAKDSKANDPQPAKA
jgi:hypothetical protein